MDYSNRDNWLKYADKDEIEHGADLFYLYPTCGSHKSGSAISEPDGFMRKAAEREYLQGPDSMSSYTNVFVPLYRQVAVGNLVKELDVPLEELPYFKTVMEDVYAALDWYFENCNEGRPYILAGHSQGSCALGLVLSDYMKAHPEYYERMVACYAIGKGFTPEWLDKNPHIKAAEGESDYGVLISWNTEGPDATAINKALRNKSYCINPLNWRTDGTPAGVDENLGSVIVDRRTNAQSFVPGIADATINTERGVLICTTSDKWIPANELFGDRSFHFNDWSFYYGNVKDNAIKRIRAFEDRI